MKGLSLIILLVLLTGAGLSGSNVKLNYFNVDREGNAFAIAWKAEVEEDVRTYELFRKTSYTGSFTMVQAFNAHGIGKEYQFKDDQVYKAASEQVDYRLEVVFSNGIRQQIAEKKVNYTPTAIRRTWGSIKAMFQ
jgi:hypothetical protein